MVWLVSRLARGGGELSNSSISVRDAVGWSDWTEGAALEFGQQKARLERLGERLDDMDIVVGSVALSVGAAVATRNVRHFTRIEGLAVDDWTRPG